LRQEAVAEPLSAESLDRLPQQARMVAHHMRTEVAVGTRRVALLAEAPRQVQDDGDGQRMVFAGQANEIGAVFAADVGGVHHGQQPARQAFPGDELHQLEGLRGCCLAGGVVAHHAPAGVGRDHLRRREVLAREPGLAGAGRADQQDQGVLRNLYPHRRKDPIWVGAPRSASTSPTAW